jgi:HEAT repeat protein
MENQSFVTWGDFVDLDETHVRDYKFYIDVVNVHELAHTYFGNLTVIRYFEHAWLKESWATYMESVWIEENFGKTMEERRNQVKLYRFADQESYFSETDKYTRPIVCRRYDHSWDMFDSHTYPGGSARLHILRCFLGDDVFWKAITEYLQQFSRKTVETEDFKKVLESVSGLNLTQFFQQWFYSKGYPKVKATYEYDATEGSGSIKLEQSQVDLSKKIPLFSFDTLVEITFEDKTTLQCTGSFSGNSYDAQAKTISIPFSSKSKPLRIEIDPHQHNLFKLEFNPGKEMLLNIAQNGCDVINRILAYRTLCAEHCDLKTAQKLGELIKNEPCAGVRVEAMVALAKIRHSFAISALIAAVDQERDDLVRYRAIGALAFPHRNVRSWALGMLPKMKELTYRQQGAVLKVLSSQLNADDINVLVEYSENSALAGHNGTVRSAAFEALGRTRSEKGAQYLLSKYDGYFSALQGLDANPEHERVRASLLRGLSQLVPWMDSKPRREEILQKLVQAVYDPHSEKVRRAAFYSVMDVGTSEASAHAPFLSRAVKSLFSAQEQVRYRKALDDLKSDSMKGGSDVGKLTKRLEDVEKQLKKLQESHYAKNDEENETKQKGQDKSAALINEVK